MKIKGWWCPTEGIEVPLDHYESGACADEPMPAEWIMAIYDQNAGDTTHADLQITATRMMACPRKVAIEDGIPTAPDPMALNAMFQGTVRHYYMQHKTRAGSYKEVVFPPEGAPPVPFLGTVIERATVDNATADLACIKDYKTGSEASHNFTFSRGCPKEEQAQASIYKIVMERSMPGVSVEKAIIWHNAQVSGRSKAPAWYKFVIPRDVPWLSEEQIGEMHPKDSEFTVREHIAQLLAHKVRIGAGESVRESIRKMPLVGRKMMGGKGCQYCAVARECNRLEGIVNV